MNKGFAPVWLTEDWTREDEPMTIGVNWVDLIEHKLWRCSTKQWCSLFLNVLFDSLLYQHLTTDFLFDILIFELPFISLIYLQSKFRFEDSNEQEKYEQEDMKKTIWTFLFSCFLGSSLQAQLRGWLAEVSLDERSAQVWFFVSVVTERCLKLTNQLFSWRFRWCYSPSVICSEIWFCCNAGSYCICWGRAVCCLFACPLLLSNAVGIIVIQKISKPNLINFLSSNK